MLAGKPGGPHPMEDLVVEDYIILKYDIKNVRIGLIWLGYRPMEGCCE
jgi:hypothetical protein